MIATATAMTNRKAAHERALDRALRINKNVPSVSGHRPNPTNAAKAATQARRSTRIGGTSPNALVASDPMAPSIRKGSMDALVLPSRVGNVLHYRDGSTRDAPIATQTPLNPYAAFNRG